MLEAKQKATAETEEQKRQKQQAAIAKYRQAFASDTEVSSVSIPPSSPCDSLQYGLQRRSQTGYPDLCLAACSSMECSNSFGLQAGTSMQASYTCLLTKSYQAGTLPLA